MLTAMMKPSYRPFALATCLLALLAACGDDGNGGYCLPQGHVVVGAIGTAGAPLPSYADCYSGMSPTLSLDSARTATVSGNTITFDDAGLTAQVDEATCRISITYEFASMLSDGTPTSGTSQFAASPDGDTFTADPDGSVDFSWTNSMGNTNVCGNQLDGVTIEVQPN